MRRVHHTRQILIFLTGLLAALVLLWGAQVDAQEMWFEAETLNPGLAEAPDTLDRSTPMAAMESFLYLTEREDFGGAAHVLDLNDVALADPENSHLRSMATAISAARKFVIVIAVFVASGVILMSANTFNTLGFSLLASAGALTIVLGFAAREVLGNILASVQIALNRSARIGDQLIFEGHFCTVERIHFTYVQLMVWNGTRLIVPVSYFVKDAFENWSLEDPAMVRPIELTLAQSADVDRLRKVFLDLLDDYDDTDVGPMARAKVHVTGQNVFGVTVRFELPARNPATGWEIECAVREALLRAAALIEHAEDIALLPRALADMPEG